LLQNVQTVFGAHQAVTGGPLCGSACNGAVTWSRSFTWD